jgi:PadR family transcriptional regulator, regulatory protein PadR
MMSRKTADASTLDAAKKGSADLLILALVEREALHGYDIGRQLDQRSAGTLRFTLASLYATLYRLEDRGLIAGRWVERAGQRRRRYYRITEPGRRMLATQRADWARFIEALVQVAGVKPA